MPHTDRGENEKESFVRCGTDSFSTFSTLLFFFSFFVLQRIARRERERGEPALPRSGLAARKFASGGGRADPYTRICLHIPESVVTPSCWGNTCEKAGGSLYTLHAQIRTRERVDLHNAIQLAFEFNLNARMLSVYIYT